MNSFSISLIKGLKVNRRRFRQALVTHDIPDTTDTASITASYLGMQNEIRLGNVTTTHFLLYRLLRWPGFYYDLSNNHGSHQFMHGRAVSTIVVCRNIIHEDSDLFFSRIGNARLSARLFMAASPQASRH